MYMDHGSAAPGGGVQAGLPPGYRPTDIIERRGQGPCHNFNHYIFLGCLLIHPLQEKNSYMWSRRCFPLKLTATASGTRADALFRALHEVIPRPHPRTFPWNACISKYTWYLIYKINPSRRYPERDQLWILRLGQIIRDNLRADWARRVTVAGREIEALLSGETPLFQGKFGCG